MEILAEVLPLLIYILVAVLLVVLIILGIKLVATVEKTNTLLDDFENKSRSLDNMFSALDNVSGMIAVTSDRLIDMAISFIGNLFKRGRKKKKNNNENEEEDYYE